MLNRFPMFHYVSEVQSRLVIADAVRDVLKTFAGQELFHAIPIAHGGERRWGAIFDRSGWDIHYIMIDLKENENVESWDVRYKIVKSQDEAIQWLLDRGCNMGIEDYNWIYQKENVGRWLTSLDKCEQACRQEKLLFISSFDINENRRGQYVISSRNGKFLAIVDIRNDEDLFQACDIVKDYPKNYSRKEMVDNKYLSVADHTSWLGDSGRNVHAVEAYFRQIKGSTVYFSLDTWCGGNHWKAHEHSPKPDYPTSAVVTCKKCLKKLAKLGDVLTPFTEAKREAEEMNNKYFDVDYSKAKDINDLLTIVKTVVSDLRDTDKYSTTVPKRNRSSFSSKAGLFIYRWDKVLADGSETSS